MRLNQPFLELPITFCADTLAAEVRALPPSAWQPHPSGFVGNEAVPLVSPKGAVTDSFEGPMAATPSLLSCPYIMEIMAELGSVWGRSRLMGLAPGRDVPMHVDSNYYWRTHHRVHIPVVTNPGVSFTCGDETVHMAAGECWMFDNFRWHTVHNAGGEQRIHLVLDTVGGEHLFGLAAMARSGATADAAMLSPGQRTSDGVEYEQVNFPEVMSPWEIMCHLAFVAEHAVPDPALAKVFGRMNKFVDAWAAAWSRFGTDSDGLPTYRQLLETTRQELEALGIGPLKLRNRMPVFRLFDELIFAVALARPNAAQRQALAPSVQRLAS